MFLVFFRFQFRYSNFSIYSMLCCAIYYQFRYSVIRPLLIQFLCLFCISSNNNVLNNALNKSCLHYMLFWQLVNRHNYPTVTKTTVQNFPNFRAVQPVPPTAQPGQSNARHLCLLHQCAQTRHGSLKVVQSGFLEEALLGNLIVKYSNINCSFYFDFLFIIMLK